MPKYLSHLLKAAIACTLVYLIVTMVDLERTMEVLIDISPLFFGLAVCFAILDQVILGFKWNILLRVFGIHISSRIPILAYLRGKAFEIAAPSTLGVDAFKLYHIKSSAEVDADKVMSSIVVERFFGALSSFLVIGLMFWFAIEPFGWAFRAELAALALVGTALLLLIVKMLLGQADRAIGFTAWSKLPTSIQDLITKVVSNLQAINSDTSQVYKYLAFSCIEKFSYGIIICLCAKAIGGIEGVDYLFILAATPLMALLERLPISLAAIGVREGFYMLLFAPFTDDTAAILAVALAVRACEFTMIALVSVTWVGKLTDWKTAATASV